MRLGLESGESPGAELEVWMAGSPPDQGWFSGRVNTGQRANKDEIKPGSRGSRG